MQASRTSADSRPIGPIMVVAILARMGLNTARRFAYPFAPALSRGLGVPLSAITSIIALSQGAGLVGIVLGPLTDQIGFRVMMLAALGLLSAGMLLGGAVPAYSFVMAAIVITGVAKTLFDPAIQAYVAARVPYHRRGFVIGLLEVGWAGSSLLGLPLLGLLFDRVGWRAPFLALGAWSAASLLALWRLLPRQAPRPAAGRVPIWHHWRQLLNNRAALGILCSGFLSNAANDTLFVVYGAWFETTFGLSAAALGLSAAVIGIAELGGEGLTAFLADRLGLSRAVMLGTGASGLSYGLLLFVNHSLPLALSAMFIIFIAFEFTIVSSLSYSTELLPQARATMVAGYLAAANAGRAVGALLGAIVWNAGGISATAGVCAALSAASVFMFARLTSEKGFA